MKKTTKRILAGLAAFLIVASIVLTFAGCASIRVEAKEAKEVEETDDGSTFILVDADYYCWIVYHKDTKVMYAVSRSGYNAGTYTLLVNADGTPMVWEG